MFVVRPPCELIQREYLQTVRQELAKTLREHGLSQMQIADKLGVTQAAVSKYLGQEQTTTPLASEVVHVVKNMADAIMTGASDAALIGILCKTCMLLRIGGRICTMHRELHRPLDEAGCQICTSLLGGPPTFSERAAVLADMKAALAIIESATNFHLLIPQVRTNLVMCDRSASSTNDVVGVPGRITVIGTRARALMSPAFGASGHTAGVLLAARRVWPAVFACLGVRATEGVIREASRAGFKIFEVPPEEYTLDCLSDFLQTLPVDRTCEEPALYVHGHIGIEPILYLFGVSASALAQRAATICAQL